MKKILFIALSLALVVACGKSPADSKSGTKPAAPGKAKIWDSAGKEVKKTSSGLQYIVFAEGDGPQAVKGKNVAVHYTGYLENGTIFDSSINRGTPIRFPLGAGRVIKGWDEGVALMKKGGRLKLIIPASLGYGSRGVGPIPANSKLYFDVELVEIN